MQQYTIGSSAASGFYGSDSGSTGTSLFHFGVLVPFLIFRSGFRKIEFKGSGSKFYNCK